jgi:hypothetical protein
MNERERTFLDAHQGPAYAEVVTSPVGIDRLQITPPQGESFTIPTYAASELARACLRYMDGTIEDVLAQLTH